MNDIQRGKVIAFCCGLLATVALLMLVVAWLAYPGRAGDSLYIWGIAFFVGVFVAFIFELAYGAGA